MMSLPVIFSVIVSGFLYTTFAGDSAPRCGPQTQLVFLVTAHGAARHSSDSLPHCKRLQGAVDARKRPVRYTSVCGQADNKADAVPCDRLLFLCY